MHARSLLVEIARQYVRDNNGRLLASRAYMAARGWASADMLTKAKRELLEGGFVFETVKGCRPNKASWYAITWQTLDRHSGFDPGAVESFRRAAYLDSASLKNASLRPPHGTERASIVPPHGTEGGSPVPPHGPIEAVFDPSSVPPHGNHLDMPSPGSQKGVEGRRANSTLAELWEKLASNKSRLWHVGPRGPVMGVGALMPCIA